MGKSSIHSTSHTSPTVPRPSKKTYRMRMPSPISPLYLEQKSLIRWNGWRDFSRSGLVVSIKVDCMFLVYNLQDTANQSTLLFLVLVKSLPIA